MAQQRSAFMIRSTFFLIFSFVFISINPFNVYALFFDRVKKKNAGTSYFFYPVYLELPGQGRSVGGGTSIVRMFDSEMDVTAMHLRGDYTLDVLVVTDLPFPNKYFTLSSIYIDAKNTGTLAYDRGPDSDPKDKFILKGDVTIKGVELSLHLFDDQLEFYYQTANFRIIPKSIKDPEGEEWVGRLDEELNARGTVKGFYLDDTDDRRDPRIGYRLKLEQWSIAQSDKALGDGIQNDYDLAFYIPLKSRRHVLVWDTFFSEGKITRTGEVDSRDYQCKPEDPPECDELVAFLKKQREDESRKPNAASLGGSQRLRAYPQGRWYAAYTFFSGLEYRWYITDDWSPFDYFFWKGVNVGWQMAFFHEIGQVSEKNDSSLYKDFKTSTGIGFRMVLSDVVLRADFATGKEGNQTTVFFGYPF